MGRCAQRRGPGLVTRQRIASDLAALGVAPGDAVLFHASVGAIGWIVGGPDRVLEAFFDVLGDEGTLMAYAGWDGSPYAVTVGMDELPRPLAAAWPPFDPKTSRAAREAGLLAEYLRSWPEARRSGHPDSSFVAVGRLSEELTRDHPLPYGMGAGSPLAKLCDAGGKVVVLGAPWSALTLLHHAEHVAQIPEVNKEKASYWVPIAGEGGARWVRIEQYSTEGCLPWRGPIDLFEAIARDYVQSGRGALGEVGGAHSAVFDAAGLDEYAVAWIEERFPDPVEPPPLPLVRPAESADHRPIADLLRALREESTGTALSEGRAATVADELLEVDGRRVFVAERDGDLVGMVVASIVAPQHGGLDRAYVVPEQRRRGLLRELEIEATTYLRQCGCVDVRLHVDADNEPAREAWRALGYTPTVEYMERVL